MKIAIDITVLYIAGAGIFHYGYNLLKAMLTLPSSHEYVLLDYSPVEGEWVRNDPEEVKTLLEGVAGVRRVKGLKHRKLARMGFVQRRGLTPLANQIDQLLDGSWRRLVSFEIDRRLGNQLRQVDVFHSSPVVNCALPWAANVTTVYDLTTVLFPDFHMAAVRELQDRKFRFAQTQADGVIAISESAKRDAVEHLGLDPSRVYVVYGGVDSSFRPLPRATVAQALKPLGLVAGEYILNVGTLEPRKNLVRLLQAYQRVRRGFHPTPKLVFVGMKGWMYDEVLKQVNALNLEKDVRFLGRVESELLPVLYNGARLFAYPSMYEGFGLPVLEAMACGAPVVTSNTSSLPEVVGDAALLVDPYDVKQIAEAMIQLLTDEDQGTVLRQRGLDRSARFTWEMAAKRTLAAYESIHRFR
jgi:glycosyltransferase involved in cell wall biosynthesis